MERRLLLTLIIAVLLAPPGRAWADASIEGVVALPKPTMARPLNQRYRTDVEVPEAPSYTGTEFEKGNNLVAIQLTLRF